ncbi:UNVERIFIED_CONTAM: hypothetical protein Cloal_3321 [Acetivibrio alkalicellulosi]
MNNKKYFIVLFGAIMSSLNFKFSGEGTIGLVLKIISPLGFLLLSYYMYKEKNNSDNQKKLKSIFLCILFLIFAIVNLTFIGLDLYTGSKTIQLEASDISLYSSIRTQGIYFNVDGKNQKLRVSKNTYNKIERNQYELIEIEYYKNSKVILEIRYE